MQNKVKKVTKMARPHCHPLGLGARVLPWLKDAGRAYMHYRSNTGTDLWVNYQKAYEEDDVIASYIDEEIETMKSAVRWLNQNGWGKSFSITGELFAIPNGSTENWQKTIGAHYAYGTAKVYIYPKGNVHMLVTIGVTLGTCHFCHLFFGIVPPNTTKRR